MIDRIRRVSNPLTVIAIFAGVAEVAATVSLATVDDAELRRTFLWFVMLFPTGLLAAFFLTLNFNSKVLYAPSDFRDEANFLKFNDHRAKLFSELTGIASQVSQLRSEFENSAAVSGARDGFLGNALNMLNAVESRIEAVKDAAEELMFDPLTGDLTVVKTPKKL